MSSIFTWLLGDEPLRAIDVGARGALLPRLAPIAAHVEAIGFEPDAAESARLNKAMRDSGWRSARVLPYAVGRAAAARPFYVTQAPELSSLLEPASRPDSRPGWRVVDVAQVQTVPLDELAARGELPAPIHYLKLDTQGSELEILQSGEALLEDALGVALEVEFRELYRDQPLFSEIEQYLRGRGFELFLLEPAHLRTDWPLGRKRTSYADALFLRGRDWLATPGRAAALRPLLALYLLRGLYAEAHQLAAGVDAEAADRIAADYAALRGGSLRWRARLIIEAIRCALRPDTAHRHRLANVARVVYAPDGRAWPIWPP